MNGCQNIEWSPEQYIESAVAAREAGDEMLSRLEWLRVKPAVIVDLGAACGEMSAKLQALYQNATVFALDLSPIMLQNAQQRHVSCVCADAVAMPFANQSVDMVFANLLFPWLYSLDDIKQLLKECQRVLRVGGVLTFSFLGPDTLPELQANHFLIPQLIDMHEIGDLLLQTGWADPVLDVMRYDVSYTDINKMTNELVASGMIKEAVNIEESLAHYEVIFAQAFAPEMKYEQTTESGEVRIPLSAVRESLVRKKK
jgi:malonyl-CoA O-methyltransferase